MAKSALKLPVILLAALPLTLPACSREPLYGPELPVEQTARMNLFDGDQIGPAGSLLAHVRFVDGQKVCGSDCGSPTFEPGVHTFLVEWDYHGCAPKMSGVGVEAILLFPITLAAIGIVCGVTAFWPDYGRGSRDIVSLLEAGKDYRLYVHGVEGTTVYLWIVEMETGTVVGGESPTHKAPKIEVVATPDPETSGPPTSLASILWNGKWFGKDGAWSLYLEVENGGFTGRVLRRGSDPFPVTGTISPDYMVRGASKMRGVHWRIR